MEPIKQLSSTGEVGQFLTPDQFDGLSTGKCGYDACAGAINAVAPGQTNPHKLADLQTMAHNDYQKYAGPDIPSDQNGMTLDICHAVLHDHGFTSLDCIADYGKIRAWLRWGYPVIICIPEANITDAAAGGSPYPWQTAGINHVILATGQGSQANTIKFRDSANITAPNSLRPMPRDYQISVAPFWAVVVVPSWLPVPPIGFDPTSSGGEMAAITQEQYDILYKKLVATETAYNAVDAEKNAKITENTSQAKTIAMLTTQLAAAKAPVAPQVSLIITQINQALANLQKLT